MSQSDAKRSTLVDSTLSKQAQEDLWPRITAWLDKYVEYEGFKEWKQKQIINTIIAGLAPGSELDLQDFVLPAEVVREHEIVTGYIDVQRCLLNIRECEHYFRRYPFRGQNISRESHLKTCCELFFGRVYQFRERWLKQLKRIDRRTKPKGLPIGSWRKQFESRFSAILAARHEHNHNADYSDIQIEAVGIGDLLSMSNPELEHLKLSPSAYRRITKYWVQQVRAASDQLEVFLGLLAVLMAARCAFLPPAESSAETTAA